MSSCNSLRPITRMSCTVDGCEWFHDDTGPDMRLGWSVRGRTLDECVNQVSRLHHQAIEKVLAEHLATHEPVEYLRTIQRLSSRVDELERALAHEVPNYEDKLRAGQELARVMAAEMGEVTEAELEELREVWPPD